MHFSKLILPLAIATSVAAAPATVDAAPATVDAAPDTTVDPALDTTVDAAAAKNQISGIPSKSIRCGARHPREQVFTVSQIKMAADQALDLVDAGKTLGTQKYPHRYGYLDPAVHLRSECKRGDKNLQEFPITRGKYTGGDVKDIPDRIVLKIQGKNKAIYCGLMTHEGAPAAPGVNAPFTSCSG